MTGEDRSETRSCPEVCKCTVCREGLLTLAIRATGVWQALMPEDFEGVEEEIPPPMLEEGQEESPEQQQEREARNAEIRELHAEREFRKVR